MSQEFIRTENLNFAYDGEKLFEFPVLHDVNFHVERGEFVAVLGRNGSGKSTLAKLLNMILLPTKGKIFIDGNDISRADITDEEVLEIRRRVGMVFQNPDNQLVATIVEEDIAFGPENLGVEPSEIRQRVDDALALVGMSEYSRHSPHRLSGGQKQRIAIAGIIAMQPECIIFDESTAMLDPSGRREVMDTIEMLNREKGITVITITHNMDEAVRADRIVVMDEGRIIMDDTPRRVFSDVRRLRDAGLDVPQVTDLFYMLRSRGYDFPINILNEKEGAKVLLSVLGDKKNK